MNLDKKLHQPNFESNYRESVECISSKWEIKFGMQFHYPK